MMQIRLRLSISKLSTVYFRFFQKRELLKAFSRMSSCNFCTDIRAKFSVRQRFPFRDVLKKNKKYSRTLFDKVMESKGSFDLNKNEIISLLSKALEEPLDSKLYKSKDESLCSENFKQTLQQATTDELKEVLWYYVQNKPENRRLPSCLKVVKLLDRELCERFYSLTVNEIILIADGFMLMPYANSRHFIYQTVKVLFKVIENIKDYQMVHAFYFMLTVKTFPVGIDARKLQLALHGKLDDLSLDELAIIGIAFIKASTTIDQKWSKHFMEQVIFEMNDCKDSAVSAICKIIRGFNIDETDLFNVQNNFRKVMHKVSEISFISIMMTAFENKIPNLQFIMDGLEIFKKNISNSSLKSLERVLFIAAMHHIVDKELIDFSLSEIRKRMEVWEQHSQDILSCTSSLAILQVLPVDLMKSILSPEWLSHLFSLMESKSNYWFRIPVQIQLIETAALIDLNYDGQISDEHQKTLEEKVHKAFFITGSNISAAARFFHLMEESMQKLYGEHFDVSVLLPYHWTYDFTLTFNRNLEIQPIPEAWKKRNWKKVNFVPDNNIWLCLMVIGGSQMNFYSKVLDGINNSRIHHLQKLGFHVIVVRSGNVKLGLNPSYRISLLEEMINGKLKEIQQQQ